MKAKISPELRLILEDPNTKRQLFDYSETNQADLTAGLSVGKQLNRCVVRLRTTMWADKNGLHMRKSIIFLRRKSEGFNVLGEDASAAGVEEVLPRIVNMDECQDGIYEVVTCNESRDYETGYIEDYDYRLVMISS